ncbi:hypothetical protein RvY_18056 [Ramazzottius varieornatus]|uniref:Uncharacterized protein n=1 Tax=Ramazzottius varieornatus TaxID=947166 RepID=A0A1D1W510_RAMVA|nr:hypothetical protein RvY_18056 [Ramazzottius varieornatus]
MYGWSCGASLQVDRGLQATVSWYECSSWRPDGWSYSFLREYASSGKNGRIISWISAVGYSAWEGVLASAKLSHLLQPGYVVFSSGPASNCASLTCKLFV